MSAGQGVCCTKNILGTGAGYKVCPFGVTNGFIWGYWRKNNGDLNGIDAGTVLDQAAVEALLNHANDDERFYVSPNVKNAIFDRADDKSEEAEGYAIRTGERGVGSWTMELWGRNADPKILKALESMQCQELGFMRISKERQLGGTNLGDGNLVFTKIQDDTFKVKPIYASDGVVQKIMVMWNTDETEKDSDFDWIPAEAINYGVNLWYNSQPVQVCLTEVSNNGSTEVVLTVDWMRNEYSPSNQLEGFVADDFNTDGVSTAFNITDSAVLAIATAVEESTTDPNGIEGTQYRITIPDSTGDEVRFDIVKTGYLSQSVVVQM